MKTDYKFWYVSRADDGHITECAIRFYEGDITTEIENGVSITRYRRTKRLGEDNLPHFKGRKSRKEASGTDTVIFTSKDFGNIKTDDELRLFLNSQLKKDASRTPIDEQK